MTAADSGQRQDRTETETETGAASDKTGTETGQDRTLLANNFFEVQN